MVLLFDHVWLSISVLMTRLVIDDFLLYKWVNNCFNCIGHKSGYYCCERKLEFEISVPIIYKKDLQSISVSFTLYVNSKEVWVEKNEYDKRKIFVSSSFCDIK